MKRKSKFNKAWLIPLALVLCWLAVGVYNLPPVHSRLAWRVDELRTKIIYYFNPPSEAVFQPSGETALTVETAISNCPRGISVDLDPAGDCDHNTHNWSHADADGHIHAPA